MRFKSIALWRYRIVIFSTLLSLALVLPFALLSEAKKVNFGEGDKITVRLQIDEPTSVHELTFEAKRVQDPDPFSKSCSRVPITLEIIEDGDTVGSESMTGHIRNSYKEVSIDMNNDPKVRGSFNVIIRFDVPEDDKDNPMVRVDTDTIRVIDDKKNDLDIVRVTTNNS
jgi:hypothetical protein